VIDLDRLGRAWDRIPHWQKVILGAAAFLALAWVVQILIDFWPKPPTAPEQTTPTAAQLRSVCKDFVLRQLHDPRDADLEWTTDKPGATFQREDGLWVARFRGRARNQFGALRLGTFECVMQYTPPDTFRAVSVRTE
jgi:hypothetical protein